MRESSVGIQYVALSLWGTRKEEDNILQRVNVQNYLGQKRKKEREVPGQILCIPRKGRCEDEREREFIHTYTIITRNELSKGTKISKSLKGLFINCPQNQGQASSRSGGAK